MTFSCPAPADKRYAEIAFNASDMTLWALIRRCWLADYNKVRPDMQMNFQGVGSGA